MNTHRHTCTHICVRYIRMYMYAYTVYVYTYGYLFISLLIYSVSHMQPVYRGVYIIPPHAPRCTCMLSCLRMQMREVTRASSHATHVHQDFFLLFFSLNRAKNKRKDRKYLAIDESENWRERKSEPKARDATNLISTPVNIKICD